MKISNFELVESRLNNLGFFFIDKNIKEIYTNVNNKYNMKRKYKKEKAVMIDLSDRKNIRIIESEKVTYSDDDIEVFRQQVNDKTKEIEDFNNYVIKKVLNQKNLFLMKNLKVQ